MIAIAAMAVLLGAIRAIGMGQLVPIVVFLVSAAVVIILFAALVLAFFGFFAALGWLGFVIVGAAERAARRVRRIGTWPEE